MNPFVRIGKHRVGEGNPVYIVAEIGINHNGDVGIARRLIDTAKEAGCDAVKFQKRIPDLCVPEEQKTMLRETPWGLMTYLEYRRRLEFGKREYDLLTRYCRRRRIDFLVSCWDLPSVDMMEAYDPVCYKIASATLTDGKLLTHTGSKKRPVVLSTGMSTMMQIRRAVSLFPKKRLVLAHCTSTYPCEPSELNLKMITTLKRKFSCPVGYSGHEVGLQTTYAAVALGASYVERHITLDRAMWGSDQAMSVGPSGLQRLVRDIRIIEQSLGDGVKKIYAAERPRIERLRNYSELSGVK